LILILKNKIISIKISSTVSLTIQEQEFLIELLRLINKNNNKKKNKNKNKNKKQNKQNIEYVNELQKKIAQQYDINLPKPPSKSISNSYGK
jgi:hypothetical protein